MGEWVSKEEALAKMQRYCAYQERCHEEVRSKLLNMGVYSDWREEIIVQLIEENFLNEERFARSFARGKFRIKQWGRNRIRQELKKRKISDYCVRKAMEEIEEADYRSTLETALVKKNISLDEEDAYQRKAKLARYAVSRGFESELAWQLINDMDLFPQ
ncbi:MAG: RecX family transcriptional regulator [Lewinellaceae bacterium]|nr:RecX family transcriptional regulator [Phaeodactylibacter sp.]MCB0616591.1 RecX family transcriptional regulator [Phaeodactylibacter sp.]MCB9347649.1 RecX family transcriptional regulator [Lewinellaceae bacterium]